MTAQAISSAPSLVSHVASGLDDEISKAEKMLEKAKRDSIHDRLNAEE
jgi:hypothetical protein